MATAAGAAAGRAATAGRAAVGKLKERAVQKEKKGIIRGGVIPSRPHFEKLFSLEGIMILITAGLFDILGLIDVIPIIGTFMSFVFDIIALLLIGSWLIFFRGKSPILRRATLTGGGFIAEAIPVLGILPFWIGVVLTELLLGD